MHDDYSHDSKTEECFMTPFKEELSIAKTPNGLKEKIAIAWMGLFFRQCGDQVPNSDEIHLESQQIKSIWKEYSIYVLQAKKKYRAMCILSNLY